MSTNNPDSAMNRLYRTRWFMPAFCVLLAALIFTAFAIGGDAAGGAISAAVLLLVGAVFYFGGRRSETLAGLGGPGRDERWERIDVHATALTGLVLVVVIIGAWLVEIAQGKDGSPYTQLGAIGGLAYVLAVALLRWRS
jgi:uncharacterized YccA/Bax inhibitor family protein